MNGFTDETFATWYERLDDLQKYDYDTEHGEPSTDEDNQSTTPKELNQMLEVYALLPQFSIIEDGTNETFVYDTETGDFLGFVYGEPGSYQSCTASFTRTKNAPAKTFLSAIKNLMN